MTKFLNISVDNTLGGNSPSDVAVASQKAVKEYIDSHSSGTVGVDDVTISRNTNQQIQAIGLINKNEVSGATNPLYDWVGTRAEWEDGSQSTWYCWENSNLTWSTQTLSYSANWRNALQSDTTLAIVDGGSTNCRIAYTTDGDNWSYSNLPTGNNYYGTVYGDGKFIACAYNSNQAYYSTDLTNWNSLTLPVSGYWSSSIYANGLFIISGGNTYITSTDGTNWTPRTFPNSLSVYKLAYGNGIFVGVAQNNVITSSDGINWTTTAVSNLSDISPIAFGNGLFVIPKYRNTYEVLYSTDGINWSTADSATNSYWARCTFGGGVFVAVDNEGNCNYSRDGIHWFNSTINTSGNVFCLAYFADRFIFPSYQSATIEKSSFTSTSQYTLDASPTTSSDLYSAVETPSALTITSVGTGYISLSDGYDYYYNSDGNQFTYRSIGDIHPDWLCYILGDSLKLGTTTIANYSTSASWGNITGTLSDQTDLNAALSGKQDVSNLVTSVSSSSTDSQYPSAKLFYDTCGDIETLINAL